MQSPVVPSKKCFWAKKAQKPYLWAVHTYMAYIREYLPGSDPFHDC